MKPEMSPVELLARHGGGNYSGEPVSQLEHALQCAALATGEGATEALVVAALLHDIGHLVHSAGEDATLRGIDARHEVIGSKVLTAQGFGPAVTEPVRLHVAAKRWLCRDDNYRAGLSAESERSLQLQGGPMSDAEAEEFEAHAWSADALRLRRWDDTAKVEGLQVPQLDEYLRLLAVGGRLA